MIHTSANDVPPFPRGDTLLDRHAWPPFINAVGRRFELTMIAQNNDFITTPRSVDDVHPGTSLSLSYANHEGPGPGDVMAGPWYIWNKSGRLETRIWCEPDTTLYRASRYSTYNSGRLSEYQLQRRKQWPGPDDTLVVFTECFEENGNLAGFSYDLFAGGQKESQWWWGGVSVSAREWDAYRRGLFKLIH